MNDPAIRINARLSGEDARRFRELERLEGSATNVIRVAVREYHDKRLKPRRSAYEIMTESGFIGGGEGPADLSSRYKDYLGKSLGAGYEADQREARESLSRRPGAAKAPARKSRG